MFSKTFGLELIWHQRLWRVQCVPLRSPASQLSQDYVVSGIEESSTYFLRFTKTETFHDNPL